MSRNKLTVGKGEKLGVFFSSGIFSLIKKLLGNPAAFLKHIVAFVLCLNKRFFNGQTLGFPVCVDIGAEIVEAFYVVISKKQTASLALRKGEFC